LELFIFGRFHARPGDESAVEEALRNVVGPSREEAGCLSGPAAYGRFIERVQALIDHPLDVTRTRLVG
jgi:hypothetical protein